MVRGTRVASQGRGEQGLAVSANVRHERAVGEDSEHLLFM